MTTLEEIRRYFAFKNRGAQKLTTLNYPYTAWYVCLDDGYGVAIPYTCEEALSEYFSSVKLKSCTLTIDGSDVDVLFLSCFSDELKYEFAAFCAEFVDPGDKGATRHEIIKNPVKWWKRWRELLGNTVSEHQSYSVIGEMMAYEQLVKDGVEPEWKGPEASSHDVECKDFSVEVKSTLKKSDAVITISSQHQLFSEKRLYLYFCRFEKSNEGVSINDMVERLKTLGCDQFDMEKKLERLGLENGRSIRKEKYKILEKRKYIVDENFPRIIKTSFKDDQFPSGIVKLQYDVDLEILEYTTW
ncbi:MAG: PD-(D/E)XK motif protein [Clostridiales bacterium]|nr:PD-(D/E)XK motif protein [Clostridiales bacterium]